jgi:hypothetical protein
MHRQTQFDSHADTNATLTYPLLLPLLATPLLPPHLRAGKSIGRWNKAPRQHSQRLANVEVRHNTNTSANTNTDTDTATAMPALIKCNEAYNNDTTAVCVGLLDAKRGFEAVQH